MNNSNDVWFVYDGACPICSLAANRFAIVQTVGDLKILDARTNENHPVLQEIKAKQLDLDTSMVIKMGQKFYQGPEALHLMAMLGTNRRWFNRLTYLLFRHRTLSKFSYPILRLLRNILIRLRRQGKIRNLEID
ncbi:DCC1-like thiol-disulfide oxidoreductase family protein [Sneathiella glossodoripedis]|uniref:DCC1-like thiol-disulfide oxidoreductase family protein n=1 Tax=Sneathiella glossodoripedis TaxID=418853 RepID=UPI00047213CD|nr:DCC1-like thiol-disulfide oxidoreductase family protein [Sneathiella glossodoripedis]